MKESNNSLQHQTKRKKLESELAETKEKIHTEEAKDVDDMDIGRLGWLHNHAANIQNRLNGNRTVRENEIPYKIMD